jgi:hypothetical protein
MLYSSMDFTIKSGRVSSLKDFFLLRKFWQLEGEKEI